MIYATDFKYQTLHKSFRILKKFAWFPVCYNTIYNTNSDGRNLFVWLQPYYVIDQYRRSSDSFGDTITKWCRSHSRYISLKDLIMSVGHERLPLEFDCSKPKIANETKALIESLLAEPT